ncbi:MAG TPA: DNA-formamidopyrimidine glycosylase [Candidatus Acidoferrales bacterium]|nr:DNA-formamidopyrimidine glycosylase [Candidatus Acidoferrales bacterium]
MPELPEVEAIARTLRPLVRGQVIARCRVRHPIAVRPQGAAALRRGVEGQRIMAIERRGKYLLLRLGRGSLVLHFRLDGQLVWFPQRRTAGHIDVALELGNGTLGFVDRRHFGRVHWLARPEDSPGIRRLGVDPLSTEFTPQRLAAVLKRARRPVKLLLMDQARIAGLGNIYSNEALWRARVSPRRRANRLASDEVGRLHKGVVSVLRRALECCLDPAPDFRDAAWWFQGLEEILHVYDREGKACRRCSSRIRRIEQGGRSSYFCPGCQR